ncbi:MAG TPA: histidine--tRNA ligase [Thermoanaerobaculia bacterium]|nr:histidine--tRNA ligase [Thermoanaerobaculia bacterium]
MSAGAVRSVKGTRDLLPPETAVWAAVENVARRVFTAYGYGEVRTPVLEETDLFVRGVGATTDIVGKEMYTFRDKKGRSLTLRPENTAPVVRAFVEHGMHQLPAPVKLFYIGPQFRYERPQAGRYRQFHQIGAELLGDPAPEADVEVILMLMRFLRELRFTDLVVLLNTVGDQASRAVYGEALRDFLRPHAEELGEDSRRRLETNPLRLLDTKDPRERELLAAAPALSEFLSAQCRAHFECVTVALSEAGVPFEIEPRLVRGLDYYTETVFEIAAEGLGAQNAVVGGGRYDGLVAELGGPDVPGVGFAIGEDRLIELLPEEFRRAHVPPAPVVVIPVGPALQADALRVAETLRDAGVPALLEARRRSLGSALRGAEKRGARWVVLLFDEEAVKNEATLKDLTTGEQTVVARSELPARLQQAAPLPELARGRP